MFQRYLQLAPYERNVTSEKIWKCLITLILVEFVQIIVRDEEKRSMSPQTLPNSFDKSRFFGETYKYFSINFLDVFSRNLIQNATENFIEMYS